MALSVRHRYLVTCSSHCNGRIVYGDECAVLRERVVSILTGSPKIVVNLAGVGHIDSQGVGMLVGLLISARNRAGDLKLASPRQRIADLLRRTSLETIFRVYANKRRGGRSLPQTGSLTWNSSVADPNAYIFTEYPLGMFSAQPAGKEAPYGSRSLYSPPG
jgi:anti-anti-sigma factor